MTSSMQKVKYSDNTQFCVYLLCWLTSSVQSLSCIPPCKKEVILCKKKINFFPLCLMRCTLISFKKLTFFFLQADFSLWTCWQVFCGKNSAGCCWIFLRSNAKLLDNLSALQELCTIDAFIYSNAIWINKCNKINTICLSVASETHMNSIIAEACAGKEKESRIRFG